MGCFRQSKRRVALFLEQVLNQPCSPGWVVKLQNQATAALRPAYDELAAQLPAQAVLGIDETPTQRRRGQVLAVDVRGQARSRSSRMRPTRGPARSRTAHRRFTGVVNCDRAKMYWNVGRTAVVLGPSETRLSSPDRSPGMA